MSDLEFENEGLAILVDRSKKGEATVTWKGVSDARSPGQFLNPLTERLVKELHGLDITLDFSAVEYMNSATVAPLINCIKKFDAAGNSVLVVFSDADWQRTHAQCTRTIARTLTGVRVETKSAK